RSKQRRYEIRYSDLSPTIHFGARPRPLQVWPVSGSRYLGAGAALAAARVVRARFLAGAAVSLAGRLLLPKRNSCGVSSYSAMSALICLTTLAISRLRA